MLKDYEGKRAFTLATLVLLIGTTLISFLQIKTQVNTLPLSACLFLYGWLLFAILSNVIMLKSFSVGWLLTMFSFLVAWRIAGLLELHFLVYALLLVFILLILNFAACVYRNLTYPEQYSQRLSLAEWQLVFIRLYIGFDFIPHFTEKLFAGPKPHLDDVSAFISLQVPDPNFFVWLAGFCELGAAIAIGLGLFMRVGALGAALYVFIATILGKHFTLGFIWANSGGGWEYPIMWIILILTFVITGFHRFSLDEKLEKHLPKILHKIL